MTTKTPSVSWHDERHNAIQSTVLGTFMTDNANTSALKINIIQTPIARLNQSLQ